MVELVDAPMFTDPAVIAAISCCWLERSKQSPSRVVSIEVVARHPAECQFCVYPLATLMDYINDFNDWVADGSVEAGRAMVQWSRLNRDTQRALVVKAGLGS